MKFPRSLALGIALVGLLSAEREASSQGILLDRRPSIAMARSFEVKDVSINAAIREQVAEVRVSQTFHNPGSFQVESEFLFPLPEDGAIQNFVLLVDGKELPGRLLGKDEARRVYEEIVRSRRDPALLEYMGRGLYKTSVFPIPPGADRQVTMRYTQVCKRESDVVEFGFPCSTQKFTSKPIKRLSVNVSIASRDAIKSVYSPSYDARIDRAGDHDVRVSYEQRDMIPSSDFRLIYTLAEGAIGASVLSYRPGGVEDGYFLLLASPRVKRADTKPQPKTVIFVLDRSGSMAGKKIEQARNALKFVLGNLREDDTFNIVVYDDRVETYRPELERYSTRSREDAARFVENIREGGSTNIDAALKTALAMVPSDSNRPSYVLFLTDGLPTAGETKETAITANCKGANKSRVRIFSFGVGFDVNARLLDRISGGNSGTSEYVKPDEDIEAHVARFYGKMTSPVLADIRVEFNGVDTNRTYPRDVPDLFDGGQLVLAGRYRQAGRTAVRISGKVDGERKTYEFPVELTSEDRGTAHDFVEKLWATRRVGDLIDQIDLQGRSRELVDELVALSTKYGILTPYTSFLADETVPLHAFRANGARAAIELEQLDKVSGALGVNQRSAKSDYQLAERAAAPSFSQDGFGLQNGSQTKARRSMRGMSEGAQGQMMGVMGGGGMGGSGFGVAMKDAEGKELVVGTVRQLGSKTFYRKGDHWVDSSLKAEDAGKARVVKQFSDEFFAIARRQGAEMNQYLTFDEPVTVRLGDQVYRFEGSGSDKER